MPTSFTDPADGDFILDTHIDQFIAPINNIENGIYNLAIGASGTDDYTATVTPAPPTLNSGSKGYYIKFIPDVNNIGPCTLNLNSGGSKSIKTATGADPASDALYAGGVYLLTWDGTYWQIASGSYTSASAATTAAEISFDDTALSITAADAQIAIEEVLGAVEDHIADSSAAHAASAISNTPAGSISATTVQAAIDELDGDVTTHISDATGAHDASAISVDDSGFTQLVGTDVQAIVDYIDVNMNTESGGFKGLFLTKSTQQTGITSQTWTKLTGFDTQIDTETAFSSNTYTVPITGSIKITINLIMSTFGGGSTSQVGYVCLKKNGSILTPSITPAYIPAGWTGNACMNYQSNFDLGDTIEFFFAFADSTTNASVGSFSDPLGSETDIVAVSSFIIEYN